MRERERERESRGRNVVLNTLVERYGEEGDDNPNNNIRRKVTVGENVWRKVKGLMEDRSISRNVKGNVLYTSATPTYI